MSGPRLRLSIRTRLTLAGVVVTAIVLTVASFTLVAVQRRSLTHGIDESLRQTADNLQPLDSAIGDLPATGDPEDTFTQLLAPDGQILASTPNAAGAPVITPQARDLDAPSIRTVAVARPPGQFRVLLRPVVNIDEDRVLLVVGKNLDDVSESVRVLVTALAVMSPALLVLLGGLTYWLVGRTLRPVDDIRREVQNIGGGDLHRRVPVPDTDDEIATLARTMNRMLARVQEANDQQQQFVDDASHELRTPLTRMIAELDIALAHPEHEPASASLRRTHDGAIELHRLLEDLLFLARSVHAGVPERSEVDLDDIVLAAAASARPITSLAIDTTGVSAAPTRGDRRTLTRAIDNIVANAVHHARSTVTLACRAGDGHSVITVDDDGDGIPPADRERVFTRFTRLDEARSRDNGGSGLGLAIAREIVTRHDGTITISESPSGGARFTVSLPSAHPRHRING